DDQEPLLVVEATIENGLPPYVILTRSTGYFSEITPAILAQGFVRNADVFVSNGTLTHKLREYVVPLAPGISGYYYTIDSSNLATAFTGSLDQQYSLRIVTGGKEYTATTTIPAIRKQIDSVWWKPAPATDDTTKAIVMVKVTDPQGFGDYVRYFTKINQGPFLPPASSVFDDLFIDGTSYEVQVQPGIDRNLVSDSIEYNFFTRGDTVQLKLSDIDKQNFDFWRTWESAYFSIGNPFSTPTRILGNVSNGALGYFAGYANQYRSLVIPQ
ncbi:MAG: DUF4249 domain-containing protein, partial [Flavisolibacter sp.]